MRFFYTTSFCLLCSIGFGQVDRTSELFITLFEKDSLIFNLGFNQCAIQQFELHVSEGAEFFHDQSGYLASKQDFVQNIKENLCKMENRPRREIVPESVEVFVLKNQGVLYGAIQNGVHKFFISPDGKNEIMTSIAKFTHLWLLEDGEWRLARILSYDHQSP